MVRASLSKETESSDRHHRHTGRRCSRLRNAACRRRRRRWKPARAGKSPCCCTRSESSVAAVVLLQPGNPGFRDLRSRLQTRTCTKFCRRDALSLRQHEIVFREACFHAFGTSAPSSTSAGTSTSGLHEVAILSGESRNALLSGRLTLAPRTSQFTHDIGKTHETGNSHRQTGITQTIIQLNRQAGVQRNAHRPGDRYVSL
jgi:hypothetical protein